MAKHYVISDIHGMYDIYEQANNLLEPDDEMIFLGDAGDRGYAGFKCIKAIYENPQWHYIQGNHEDFMIKALKEYKEGNHLSDEGDFSLWMWNGGQNTFNGWVKDGEDFSWIDKLEELPDAGVYRNSNDKIFYLTHAGFTPGIDSEQEHNELLWNRNHFCDEWDEKKYPNTICIHGHTPMRYLVNQLQWFFDNIEPCHESNPEARVYCNGHKICIDNGAFYTYATVVYDLDEEKAIPVFSDKYFGGNDEQD